MKMIRKIKNFYPKYRYIRRRFTLFYNRLRANYQVRKDGKFFRIVIPNQHRNKVRFLKYIFTAIGLLSAFIAFGSVLTAFLFGLGIYLLTLLVEKTVFLHPTVFIHALPDFEIDNNKWVGVGFGYASPPSGEYDIPLVSMMIADLDYAKKIASLFLQWTGGSYKDEEKNVQISIVATKPDEYIFLCYPNPKRPLAKRFFDQVKQDLRQTSLEDEIGEGHVTFVLGKRCSVGPSSYFPQFRERYRDGVPIMFEFILPPFETPKPTREIPNFVFFDFSIKDRSQLTRKDLPYGAIYSFEHGGKWQGPEHLDPDKKNK
jgi:hypothetical protein